MAAAGQAARGPAAGGRAAGEQAGEAPGTPAHARRVLAALILVAAVAMAGIVAVLLGAALVFFLFPGRKREEDLLTGYEAEDAGRARPGEPPARHRKLGQRWLLQVSGS